MDGLMMDFQLTLPPMLLFALFTEGPSPRHEKVLHPVEVTP